MLSLRVTKIRTALLLAAAALLVLCGSASADTLSLWNGEIKKGDVSSRAAGAAKEIAVDELGSALGIVPKSDPASYILVLDGKKIEFWNASNVIRAAGTIISLPAPVTAADGHWWADSKAVALALGHFYRALGKPSSFEWRGTGDVPPSRPVVAAPTPPAAPTAPAVKIPAQPKPKPQAAEQPAVPEPADSAERYVTASPSQVFSGGKRPVVVIDAGHGGHDPGASGNGVREKDINLKAALQLTEILRQYGVDARPSRKTDVFLKLGERTAFANANNADVFVSLHCNSMGNRSSSVSGLEYYIMASPSDKDALNLAIAENKEISDGAGVDSAKDVQRADKKTQLLLKILGDMQQNDKINSSTTLTEVMHRAAKSSGLPIRKVKQAPFFVLRGAGMPAVLVEMGYLTNPSEARKLTQAAYREALCRTMAQGIVQYIKEHPNEGRR